VGTGEELEVTCAGCKWYYRARGAWCPEHKKLYIYGTARYEELLTRTFEVVNGVVL
jgi:hypothetical protein